MPKPVKKDKQPQEVTFHLEKEKINNYNENFEKTLNNVHAIAVFLVKLYGRAGYQIKKLEEIADELKKLNKRKS